MMTPCKIMICSVWGLFLHLPASSALFAADKTPVRIATHQAKVNQQLLQAHQDLQQKLLDVARQGYENTLTAETQHTDALLALAAIAAHQGREEEARTYRAQALATAPFDPNVQAALLGRREHDPTLAESRLKILLAQFPQAASLHFVLGNLYARQSRWREAQVAYFNALAADSGNPDYLFNLAVSLDRLGHGELAGEKYRQAREAASTRALSINVHNIEQRLRELSP